MLDDKIGMKVFRFPRQNQAAGTYVGCCKLISFLILFYKTSINVGYQKTTKNAVDFLADITYIIVKHLIICHQSTPKKLIENLKKSGSFLDDLMFCHNILVDKLKITADNLTDIWIFQKSSECKITHNKLTLKLFQF